MNKRFEDNCFRTQLRKTLEQISGSTIDKETERMYERSFAGSIGYIFGQYIYDYFTDTKRIRKRNHELALKNLEDMRF